MKKIMMVLSVCLTLAVTTVSYGSAEPLSATDPATEFLGGMIEITGAGSLSHQTGTVAVKTAAAEKVAEQAHENDEGEEGEKKGGEDEDKEAGGPDRLWDAGKLG